MRSFGLALALAVLVAPGAASAAACNTHATGEAPFLCGYTFSAASLGGTSSTIEGTEFFDQIGGLADMTSAGLGGLSGTARVDVDWGIVRGFCTADNGTFILYDPINSEARDISVAEGAFADIGTLVSLGNVVPAGTPVAITVTMLPTGGFTEGAGAQIDLVVANLDDFVATRITRQAILTSTNSTFPAPFALANFHVGESLIFSYHVMVSAGTTNRVNPARVSATADMESTALLFIDVATPDVTLDTLSGHDYTTVPEPSGPLLLSAGAIALAWRRHSRRRSARGAVGRRSPEPALSSRTPRPCSSGSLRE